MLDSKIISFQVIFASLVTCILIPASIALSGEYSKTWPDTWVNTASKPSKDVEYVSDHQIVRLLEFQFQNNDDLTPAQNKRICSLRCYKTQVDPKSVTLDQLGFCNIEANKSAYFARELSHHYSEIGTP